MSPPRVAVIVACRNHGSFLPEALASVSAQTLRDYELVIVDDGSEEPETLAALEAAARSGHRVLRMPHAGLSAARNAGARATTAPYLCMLDADDKLAPEWLEKGVARLDAEPDLAFVSHWLRAFGDEQWEWRPERCDFPALLARNTVNGAALVRRTVFDAVGGFDETFRNGCEDWDFWISIVERGGRGTIVPEVLFSYRRRAGSMSRVLVESGAQREVLSALVAKHEAAFRAHLPAVVAAKEAEIAAHAREVWDLECEHAAALAPAHQQAQERLAVLTEKAARLERELAAERELHGLRQRASALAAEVDALRRSWSWRLTAPLRAVYGLLRGRGA